MAIPPKLAGQKLLATASQQPQHTLELCEALNDYTLDKDLKLTLLVCSPRLCLSG